MRLSRFLMCFAAAFSAGYAAVMVGIDRMLGLLMPTSPPRLAFDGPAPALFLGGHAIDAATQNSLRHEANVSRRSADRHT